MSSRTIATVCNPRGKAYKSVQMVRPGDAASLLAFPDIKFQVEEILSTDFEE